MEQKDSCQMTLQYHEINSTDRRAYMTLLNVAGQGALKSALFINAGAAIAVMALISNQYSKEVIDFEFLRSIKPFVRMYLLGTFLSAVAYGLVYVSGTIGFNYLIDAGSIQMHNWLVDSGVVLAKPKDSYAKKHWWYISRFINICTIVLVIAGYIVFLMASLKAANVLIPEINCCQ